MNLIVTHSLFLKYQTVLEQAIQANRCREYWLPFPDHPQAHEKDRAIEGEKAFNTLLNKHFDFLHQNTTTQWVGSELSPYGFPLNITYPALELNNVFANIKDAIDQWCNAGHDCWIGISLEILHRLQSRIFEIANAVKHTTGQPFAMAFQGGTAHAICRGLEAVACTANLIRELPSRIVWQSPNAKIEKHFKMIPRGTGLIIGCSTFTLWNAYPGLFANLATGNAVIVKPHPGAILPLAITVQVAREVLIENGLSPDLVTLVAHEHSDAVAQQLSIKQEIDLIDFTGNSANSDWLESHNKHSIIFSEKSGVNQIIIDSTDNLKGMARNIALSLCLYSGQMCTAPQNIYIPKDGIQTSEVHVNFDDVINALVNAIDRLTIDPGKAIEILGAIQNQNTIDRIDQSRNLGKVVCESKTISHPQYPSAHIRTPLIIEVSADNIDVLSKELFGPIACIVRTQDTKESIKIASTIAHRAGMLTLSAYSTEDQVMNEIRHMNSKAGGVLSFNLTQFSLMNETLPFSDFHGTRQNRAANTIFTDREFITKRFFIAQEHRQL